ncbi:hypothetical protein FEM21_11850 [Flavobacterium seoulense]|uniref:Uncharacterized protein n=1 Tax=Flavobacterium seoulense TaxID=1492738 RepID=A0A066WSM4_9FLAO|nr:hypothetical protein FEM21_11850 [Flavobacterium seoulense]
MNSYKGFYIVLCDPCGKLCVLCGKKISGKKIKNESNLP